MEPENLSRTDTTLQELISSLDRSPEKVEYSSLWSKVVISWVRKFNSEHRQLRWMHSTVLKKQNGSWCNTPSRQLLVFAALSCVLTKLYQRILWIISNWIRRCRVSRYLFPTPSSQACYYFPSLHKNSKLWICSKMLAMLASYLLTGYLLILAPW